MSHKIFVIGAGMTAADRAGLAAPVGDCLFFAGEATHLHCLATVYGAYETGVRAAREILNLRTSNLRVS